MKGGLKNCSYCHKVYLDLGEGCCSECKGKQEVQRQMVRDYMFSHGATDLISISHGTGLPLRTIMRMRKEGFLAPRQQTGVRKCRKCGVSISEGIYCLNCVASFARKRADLASRRMRDSMRGSCWGERRQADSKFLVDAFAKYGAIAGQPLLKSDRLKQRRRRMLGDDLYEYVDIYGERR